MNHVGRSHPHASFDRARYYFSNTGISYIWICNCADSPCMHDRVAARNVCVRVRVCMREQGFFFHGATVPSTARSGSEGKGAAQSRWPNASSGLPFTLTVGSQSVSSPPFPYASILVCVCVCVRASACSEHNGRAVKVKGCGWGGGDGLVFVRVCVAFSLLWLTTKIPHCSSLADMAFSFPFELPPPPPSPLPLPNPPPLRKFCSPLLYFNVILSFST